MHPTRTVRRAAGTFGALALAMALVACGTTEAAEPEASSTTDSADASPASTSPDQSTTPATADGPVTVTGDDGEVTLDAAATDVVALEWGLVENLLALGVEPVGIADVEGYNTWDTVMPIDPDTPDVGTRGEPSLDAVAALEPDLVVTTTDLPENVIAQLEDVAPVLALRGSDASDPLGHMALTVETLAAATGTQAAAETLLADFDTALADGASAIEDAGLDGAEFTMADGYLNNDVVSIRMYTPGSFLGAIGEELGMVDAWTDGGDPDYGLAATDVEGLTSLGDVAFLYAANDDYGPDPFTEGLAGNQVWESLPFVQSGNVHRIPDGIWLFGGPASGGAFVEAFVDAVTG
ncbi:iron-siderophore ABC transporter substrate-binding protein [Salsipaludibacter albus]|uniref:ABC transporter substrate-binding protein n=1 Tax=Salsipaludibacter albus TaxID=2849650 RepID=UPI001EE40A89|nr:iron-siderophore ABC transporter substrate-binding protein [Salsipaludibacter albus]MBY5161597.1 iron-siderophore ABC transporter substrate-binding protein [Salsipaludibacter albus]